MKLISLTCPHCGGALEISEDAKQANCPFCDSTVIIDDYDFEKGRLKAQQDAINVKVVVEKTVSQNSRKQNQKRKERVAGCLFIYSFFPFSSQYLLLNQKN